MAIPSHKTHINRQHLTLQTPS